MKNLLNLRNIIIIGFILLLAIGIGYKYYEWNILKTLSESYNFSWSKTFKKILFNIVGNNNY